MKRLSSLLAAILLLSCLMMACLTTACTRAPEGPTNGPTETTAAPNGTADTTPPAVADKITYTVTVVDQNGTPVQGVAIQMCTADSCLMPAATGEDGTVSFTLTPAAYHATVAVCPDGYTAEAPAEYHFEGNATALTITVNKN